MIKSLVKSLSPNQAQGRIDDGKPIAVLDIGSNSVRLVVYERHVRALTPIYNEKVACGLGRGVGQTGALAQESVERALVAMRRFALVCKITHVDIIHILATAATRDASNGSMFIEAVEEIMSAPVRILSGEEEAYFAALGTLAGMPTQNGLLGDFGGGSLEIALLEDAKVVAGETHALGAIRLQDDSNKSVLKAYELAKERLGSSQLIRTRTWPEFVAIGGTWRAIAKVHQQSTNYPLTMVQGYRVAAEELIALCSKIMKAVNAGENLDEFQRLSSNRRELLGYGAAALRATLEAGKFATVKFSALGVREGYLFEQLPLSTRSVDPLLQACEELSILRSRSPDHAPELIDFTDRFISVLGFEETVTQKRLRHAACYLGDIAWRGHPDYRGAQAVDSAAFGAFVGIDHSGRAHLARLLAVRYAGLKRKHVSNDDIFDLCKSKHAYHADMIGALFRVAYLFSAAMPGILPLIAWQKADEGLEIKLPNGMELLAAEKTVRRIEQLASFLNCKIAIV